MWRNRGHSCRRYFGLFSLELRAGPSARLQDREEGHLARVLEGRAITNSPMRGEGAVEGSEGDRRGRAMNDIFNGRTVQRSW